MEIVEGGEVRMCEAFLGVITHWPTWDGQLTNPSRPAGRRE